MEQLLSLDYEALYAAIDSLTTWILATIETLFQSLTGIINSVTGTIQSFITILTSFSIYSNMAFSAIPEFYMNMFIFALIMVVLFIFIKEAF